MSKLSPATCLFKFFFIITQFDRQPACIFIIDTKRLLQQNTAQCVTAALNDANFLAQLIIDCTSKVICDRLLLVDSDFHEIETVSRKLCFALHLKRCRLLKQLG